MSNALGELQDSDAAVLGQVKEHRFCRVRRLCRDPVKVSGLPKTEGFR